MAMGAPPGALFWTDSAPAGRLLRAPSRPPPRRPAGGEPGPPRPRRLRHEISGLGYFLLGLIIFVGAHAEGTMLPPAVQAALRFLVGSVGAVGGAGGRVLW